jgi:archaellin
VLIKYTNSIAKLHRDEKGLTAAETVIIILSFTVIVTASMYVLLSGSVFSADKSQDTILGGVSRAKSDMELMGSVIAKCVDDTGVRYIVFNVRNNVPEKPIDLTPYDGTDNPIDNTMISLSTATDFLYNVNWTSRVVGAANDDGLLEVGEQFEITIDLADLGNGKSLTKPLGINSQFTIEVKPAYSSALLIKRTMPVALQNVLDLH